MLNVYIIAKCQICYEYRVIKITASLHIWNDKVRIGGGGRRTLKESASLLKPFPENNETETSSIFFQSHCSTHFDDLNIKNKLVFDCLTCL